MNARQVAASVQVALAAALAVAAAVGAEPSSVVGFVCCAVIVPTWAIRDCSCATFHHSQLGNFQCQPKVNWIRISKCQAGTRTEFHRFCSVARLAEPLESAQQFQV